MRQTCCLGLGLVVGLGFLPAPTAHAQPASRKPAAGVLSRQQQQRLKERDSYKATADRWRAQEEFAAAIAAMKSALAIEREVYGESHEAVAASLAALAALYEDGEDFPAALQHREEALRMKARLLGDKHWEVTDARLALAGCRRLAELKPDERPRLREAANAEVKARGLHRQGRSRDALPLAQKALETRQQVLGEKHRLCATSLNQVAVIAWSLGDSARAEPLYRQALALRKELLGDKHPDYAMTLANLAAVFLSGDDDRQAEPLLRQALAIYRETGTEETSSCSFCLNSMTQLHVLRREWAQAESVVRRALAISQKAHGEKSREYRHFLGNLEQVLLAAARQLKPPDLAAVRRLHWERLTILAELHGDADWRVTDARLAWANADLLLRLTPAQREQLARADDLLEKSATLSEKKQPGKALPLAEEALRLQRQILGEANTACGRGLTWLSSLHNQNKELARSREVAQQAVDTYRRAVGDNHPLFAAALRNLGRGHLNNSDPEAALPLMRRAVALYRDSYGKSSRSYADALEDLAAALEDSSRKDGADGHPLRARKALREVVAIYRERFGEKAEKTREARSDLDDLDRQLVARAKQLRRKSLALYHQGKSAGAVPLAEEEVAIYREVLGDKHRAYATALHNLATFHSEIGNIAQAFALHRQALALRQKALGTQHEDCAESFNAMGLLYRRLGEYARAEPLYRDAAAILKTAVGEEDPFYATVLNNLAYVYQSMGRLAEALPLHEKALAIRVKVHGKKHPDYAQSLNNLGLLHLARRAHDKAEPCLRTALDVRKEALGERHPLYAQSLSNLAFHHQLTGQYRKAEPLYRQALEILRQQGGERHETFIQARHNLALIYAWLKEPGRAEPLAREAVQTARRHNAQAAAAQSERQQLMTAGGARAYLDAYVAIATAADVPAERLYEEILAWKGAVSAAQRWLRRMRPTSADTPPAEGRKYGDLDEAIRRLAAAVRSAPASEKTADWHQTLVHLAGEVERHEQALVAARGKAHAFPPTPWALADLRKALPAGTTLIDVVQYTDYNTPPPKEGGKRQGGDRLVAFVLRREGKVACVALGLVEPVAGAVDEWLREVGAKDPTRRERAAATLRRLVWDPLEPHVRGAETILFSPDGALTRFPLGALPGQKPDTYLIEERAIANVALWQLREVLTQPAPKAAPPSLLIVAGRQTDAGQATPAAAGATAEVAALKEAFGKRYPHGQVRVLSAEEATAGALRQELSRNRWAYLRTGGFFTPVEKAFGGMSVNDLSRLPPGLRSGLRLAPRDEGTLTALEAAALDLNGVDLVVLPAPEANQGVAVPGEGALSLQRAFHLAGARTTVSCLWQVDDAATRTLLAEFFRNLRDGKRSRLEALRAAQQSVLRGERRPPPSVWAAFVLSGDWR